MKSREVLKIGLLSRKVAWEVLQAVGAGAYSDAALDRAIKRNFLKGTDKALATELSYGAIRQRYFLDCWLDRFGKVPAVNQPPPLRWLLHLGLYQILKMDRIPDSAAIDTTVELAKNGNLVKLAPVVNGLLRSALRAHESGKIFSISSIPSHKLAQEESLPIWIAEELIKWKGERKAREIAHTFNRSPVIDLRVNSLVSNPMKLQKKFEDFGIKSYLIDDCPNGLQIDMGHGDIKKWPGYLEGEWSVQDRSSQMVAPLLEAKTGERILDACAAPGGKVTHIAELTNNQVDIWAVDRSEKRLQKLVDNAKRLGLSKSIKTLSKDASYLSESRSDWRGFFNKILIDAPCSGLGTLSRHPDARWRITNNHVKELVILQSKLLTRLVPLLSKGGRIVYSTCTIHPEENHFQIEKFLSKFSSFSLVSENQIWPSIDNYGDGFYTAVVEQS